jgi:tetratricopeptide (TPR) repeat protein
MPRHFAARCCLALCLLVSSLRAEEATPVPTEKASLLDRVIELNKVQEPELDAAAAHKAFDDLMERVRAALKDAKTPQEKVAALNKTLLQDKKIPYLSNKYWRDATLAACLLRGKGNCLATSTLFVVAGDALKLPIKLVLIPRHAFVRWDDGQTRINIETTAGGAELSDSDYLNRSDASREDIERLEWGKSLDDNGLVAELERTAAYHRIGEDKLEDGLKLLEQAEKLAPNRLDAQLTRLKLMADITGKRSEAREKIMAMLNRVPPIPASVASGAFSFLASDAAGSGDHERERFYLLRAFASAPKTSQHGVLTQLAFCYRALKDYHGAVRCMELALMLITPGDPELASAYYNLAILQKNDGRLKDALESIRGALKINPESWNLQMIEAGYMVLDGDKDAGLKKFAAIQEPRGDSEFFRIMNAWFYAVSKQREKFYDAFEKALSASRSTHILEWIDQDVDLDVYRNEPQFRTLLEKHGTRLKGK